MTRWTLQSTVPGCQSRSSSINLTKLNSPSIRKSIHSSLTNVEPVASMVNSQDFDAHSFIVQPPATSTVWRAPARNGIGAANVGEVGQITLLLVLGHHPRLSVRAGNISKGAVCSVIATIPRNYSPVKKKDREKNLREDGDKKVPLTAEAVTAMIAAQMTPENCILEMIFKKKW